MKNLITLFTIFLTGTFIAQHNPVSFNISQSSDTIIFDAVIEDGWHMYAAHLPFPNEGPLPTEIVFNESSSFLLQDSIIESKGHTEMDDAFGIEVKYFEKKAFFKQQISLVDVSQSLIKGTIYFMVCNDQMCIPFEHPFTFTLIKE